MASNTYTLLEVVNAVSFRCGDIKDAFINLTSDPATNHLVHCVNASIRQMTRVKGLRVKGSRVVINTIAPYITGTVAINNGSTSVTGSDTTFTAAMVGRAFGVTSDGTEYRIAAYTSETSITLDSAWVSDNVTGQAFAIAQDRYALGAGFSDINYASFDGESSGDLTICAPTEIDRQRYVMRAASMTTGKPTHITVYDKDSSNNWMIQLDPFPDDSYRVNLRAQDMPTKLTISDAATLMPFDDENIDTLIDGAVAYWKDKDQPGTFQNWIQTSLPFFAALDTKMTDERPRLVPDDVTRVQNPMGRRSLPRDTDYLLR